MKTLLTLFVLLLIISTANAESYICTTLDKYSETTIFKRLNNLKFEVEYLDNKNKDNYKIIFDLYDETEDFLVLTTYIREGKAFISVLLDKYQKEYSVIAIVYPDEIIEDRVVTGNCSIIN